MSLTEHHDVRTEDFERAWHDWHREAEARLAAPHGFLAITALHWLTEAPQRFEDVPGEWSEHDDRVIVQLAPGEQLTLADHPLSGRHAFEPIAERGGLVATYDDTELEIAKRGGRHVLRPRRPDHALRAQFHGTPTFDPDPAWRVSGGYRPFAEPQPTTVGSVVDELAHVYDAPGVVEVELAGSVHRLTAFPGRTPGSLMVLFTDATSGVTTYAANRALEIDPPGPDGTVVLDFNRARNLPCAYTDFATCPLPPAGNHLDVAVEAGERIPYERAVG